MVLLLQGKKVLLSKLRIAKNPFALAKGLMFTSNQTGALGLLLKLPRKSKLQATLTNWFVFYDLDVYFLDEHMTVLEYTVLKSFQFSYTPKYPCVQVLEVKAGTIHKLAIGTKLELKEP